MMRFFRKHRNTLMIVIAVLAIPFIFYFNKTDFSARGPGDFGKFYDRNISMVEATKYAKLLGLSMQLGMIDFIQDLTGGARDDRERQIEFIFNMLILRREADRLGIQPSSSERVDFVRNLKVFHGANGFDVGKYSEFTQEFLAPNGFTDAQVEDLAACVLDRHLQAGAHQTVVRAGHRHLAREAVDRALVENIAVGQPELLGAALVRVPRADHVERQVLTEGR